MQWFSAFWSNTKVFLMMAGLTALLGAAGQALGGATGLAVALVLGAAANVAMYFWSASLVLRMYRARVVGVHEAPALHAMVGRLRRIKQRDMLLMTVTATLAGAIANLANVSAFSSMFGGQEDEENRAGALGQLLVMLVAPVAAMLIQLAISRQREFQADALGARITGRPQALAGALAKLDVMARGTPMHVAPALAPLAQVNPLAGRAGRIAALFSTHPSTRERIERLRAMRPIPEAPALLRMA